MRILATPFSDQIILAYFQQFIYQESNFTNMLSTDHS